MEVVASLSQGRTAAAQCGLFTYKSVPVIFEPPCISCKQTENKKRLCEQEVKITNITITVYSVCLCRSGRDTDILLFVI